VKKYATHKGANLLESLLVVADYARTQWSLAKVDIVVAGRASESAVSYSSRVRRELGMAIRRSSASHQAVDMQSHSLRTGGFARRGSVGRDQSQHHVGEYRGDFAAKRGAGQSADARRISKVGKAARKANCIRRQQSRTVDLSMRSTRARDGGWATLRGLARGLP